MTNPEKCVIKPTPLMSAQAGAGQACPAGVRRHAMRNWKAPGPGSLDTGGMGGGWKQITAGLRG